MEYLRPCPRCKHEADVWHTAHTLEFHCVRCTFCGYETPAYFSERQAIDAWNKRS